MDTNQIDTLFQEHNELCRKKNEIRERQKEIAMQVLKEHFNGDCTFVTEEEREDGEYDACPTIMSLTMVKDDDPADAFITRMRISQNGKLLLDLHAYYSGEDSNDVYADDEAPLCWEEVVDCLFAKIG